MEYKLSDLINVKHGYAFKSIYFLDDSNDYLEYVLLTPGNISIGGGFNKNKIRFYSEDGPIPKEFVLESGDILICMTDLSKDMDTLGSPAMVPNHSTHKYLHNQRLGKVEILDKKLIDKKFLYYLFLTRNYRHHIISTSSGTTVHHTSPSRILEYKFDLPEYDLQLRIANILENLDKKIEINNKTIANLEEQAQAIFKSWFVEFEPFQDGKFVDSELGLIPEGWDVGTIKKLSQKIITGKTPPTRVKENYGDYIPFIKIPDMHGKIFSINPETYLSEIGMKTQKNKILPSNSICVSCIATVGLVNLVPVPSQTNQQINSIIPAEGISPYYIFFAMKNLYDYLNALGSSGSTTKNINKGTFENINLINPSDEIMSKFEAISVPIFKAIKNLQYQNVKLAETRDTLLPKLMSGEIDVSGIKIDNEDVSYE